MKSRMIAVLVLGASLILPGLAAAEGGSVVRSAYTSSVVDREPVDRLEQLPADAARVYYFTELRNLQGQTVTHRWEHGGQVMAEVPFQVGGQRWRVWSSKELQPGWTGEWSVTVVDANGSELARDRLQFGAQ